MKVARSALFTMKVARGALLNLPLPLGEGRGEGNGHGERRLSSCGVALVAMAVSRDRAVAAEAAPTFAFTLRA